MKKKDIQALQRASENLQRVIIKIASKNLPALAAPDPSDIEKFRKELGEQIAKTRQKAGITRYELAKRSKVQEKQIKRIEDGSLNVGLDSLFMVSKSLGLMINLKEK